MASGTPGLSSTALHATLSSTRPGASPVTLTLTFPSALVCGRVTGTTVVTLSPAARVPRQVPASAVTVNGRAAGTVAVKGSIVTIVAAHPRRLTCMSIVEGEAKLVFGKAAGLGNPVRSGTYPVAVGRGAAVMRTTLTISR